MAYRQLLLLFSLIAGLAVSGIRADIDVLAFWTGQNCQGDPSYWEVLPHNVTMNLNCVSSLDAFTCSILPSMGSAKLGCLSTFSLAVDLYGDIDFKTTPYVHRKTYTSGKNCSLASQQYNMAYKVGECVPLLSATINGSVKATCSGFAQCADQHCSRGCTSQQFSTGTCLSNQDSYGLFDGFYTCLDGGAAASTTGRSSTATDRTVTSVTADPQLSTGLSTGAVIGIIIGIVVLAGVAGLAVFLIWKRKRPANDQQQGPIDVTDKSRGFLTGPPPSSTQTLVTDTAFALSGKVPPSTFGSSQAAPPSSFSGTSGATSLSKEQLDSVWKGQQVRVVQNYIPQNNDELVLSASDVLLVREAFPDGWATGQNLHNNSFGLFPLACVIRDTDSQSLGYGTGQSQAIPMRSFVLPAQSANFTLGEVRGPPVVPPTVQVGQW